MISLRNRLLELDWCMHRSHLHWNCRLLLWITTYYELLLLLWLWWWWWSWSWSWSPSWWRWWLFLIIIFIFIITIIYYYSIIYYYILLYTTIYYYILSYTIIYYYILLYTIIYHHILLYTIIYYYILLHTIIICLLTCFFLLRIPCFSHFYPSFGSFQGKLVFALLARLENENLKGGDFFRLGKGLIHLSSWEKYVSYREYKIGHGFIILYGDGSKSWYPVNPKIAGKWIFIPLKMYL